MERVAVVGLAAMVIASCGTTAGSRYARPGTSDEQLRQDQSACVAMGLGTDGRRPSGPVPRIDRDAVDRCMIARGYTIADGR